MSIKYMCLSSCTLNSQGIRLASSTWDAFTLSTSIAGLKGEVYQISPSFPFCLYCTGKKGLRRVGDMNPIFSLDLIQEGLEFERLCQKKFDWPLLGICAYTKQDIEHLEGSSLNLLHQHHSRVIGWPWATINIIVMTIAIKLITLISEY